MGELVIQIPPNEVQAIVAGENIGGEGLPFRTPESNLGEVAPVIGRERELTRISAAIVARFSPGSSTAKAPEVLRCAFEVVRFGQAEFMAVLELNRVMVLPIGVAFYEGNVIADFNNPISTSHADTLAWRFVGVLQKQVVKVETEELVLTGVEEVTTLATHVIRNAEGEELERSVIEDTKTTTIPVPTENSRNVTSNTTHEGTNETILEITTIRRKESRYVPKTIETPAAGIPALFFGVGYELEVVK